MNNQQARLSFLGATGTVTGSKYLFEANGRRVLVDCGLFQGYKQLRQKNWDTLPVPPESISAVVLTHAHLDHSGYVPLLVKRGFTGPVFGSPGTKGLCGILLPDAGHLAEEDANYANRRGFSKHSPALPLYTEADAIHALKQLQEIEFRQTKEITPGITARLRGAGHILGAASVTLQAAGVTITFSGDVGRPNDPVMRPPTPLEACDYLVVESTYGNRLHPEVDPAAELAPLLQRCAARGGVAIIPVFAVGRAQGLMHLIASLKQRDEIPDLLPVYLNSPMAVDATDLYHRFRDEHRLTDAECEVMCHAATRVNSVEESKALNRGHGPMVILSASGMMSGGRVVHHLKAFASDPRNMIILTGFQAGGTRGAALAAGKRTLRIHGGDVEVRAEVAQLSSTSAHADANELIDWMRSAPTPPRRVFVTHGEPDAADALRKRIEDELGWDVMVPDYRDAVDL